MTELRVQPDTSDAEAEALALLARLDAAAEGRDPCPVWTAPEAGLTLAGWALRMAGAYAARNPETLERLAAIARIDTTAHEEIA